MLQHIDADQGVEVSIGIGQLFADADVLADLVALALGMAAHCGDSVDSGTMPVTTAPRVAIASAVKPPAQLRSSTALPGQSIWRSNHFSRPGTKFFRVRTQRMSSDHQRSATLS
jgi:hypothetical protein